MEQIFLRAAVTTQACIVSIRARINHRLSDAQPGQSLVEYALILAFVSLVIIVAMEFLAPSISRTFTHVGNCLNTANTSNTSTISGTTGSC